MTRYYTCFDDAVDDGLPHGWDKKWALAAGDGPTCTTGPAPSDFVPVKRRVLREYITATPATRAPGALMWEAPGSLADFQLLMAVCPYGDSSNFSRGVILRFRCSGDQPLDRNGYYLQFMDGNASAPDLNKTYLGKTVGGVDNQIASASNTMGTGGTSWIRVVVSGTHIQARLWADGTTEPGTWDIDTNDSSISAAGWLGWETYWKSNQGGMCDVNFMSLATGADTPVVPLTNTQFTAWLATNGVERRYLAELTAIGYAANGGASGTYTKQVNAYLSNGGFVSQAWDSPPSQLYNAWITQIPTFKRDMGQALSGKASVGIGTLSVANPADSTGQGVRDRWLRMRWKRNYIKVYMGDPTWPKHDFRCIVLGRLQRPTVGNTVDQIDFTINDLSDVLNNDINQLLFISTDYAGQRVPTLYGADVATGLIQVEPPLTDSANLIYTLSRRTMDAWASDLVNGKFVRVYDNQVALWKQFVPANGTCDGTTFTVNGHGMQNGWLYVPTTGATSGLTANFAYFVRNSTANTFQLSASPAGIIVTGLAVSAIDNAYGFGYYLDLNGDGAADQNVATPGSSRPLISTLQLVSKPAGRVTVSGLRNVSSDQISVLRQMAIDAGVPTSAVNSPLTVYSSQTCMHYVGPGKAKAADTLTKVAQGLFAYYGFAPDGFFEYGLMGFTGTTKLTLLASDIKAGTMKLLSVKQPVDFGKAQVSMPWYLTGGSFQTGSQAALQGKIALTLASAPFGVPDGAHALDTYPQIADMDQTFVADTYYTDTNFLAGILYPLLQKPIGVYQFDTRLMAMQLRIGQMISITLPREEWKNWNSGDPASPDNAGNVFSVAALVLGVEFNPSASDPYGVKLTVAKQIVGYWPNVDVIDGDVLKQYLLLEGGGKLLLESGGGAAILKENLIV